MKKLLIALLLVSCTEQPKEEGNEMDGNGALVVYPAYIEMCLREPDSTLCNAEEEADGR